MVTNSIWSNVLKASCFDSDFYEKVKQDESLSGESQLIILLSSAAAGAGMLIYGGIMPAIMVMVMHYLGWYAAMFLIYLIGGKLFKDPLVPETTYSQFCRTLGYASAPGIARVLGVIPGIGLLIIKIMFIWILIAMIVATKQALGYKSQVRTIIVCFLAWGILIGFPILIKLFVVLIAQQ